NLRLSRMLLGDLETTTQRECQELAEEVHFKVVSRIAMAVTDVVKKMPAPPRTVIAAGSGEFLVPGVLRSILLDPPLKDCPVISLAKGSGPAGSEAGCATGVAVLCKEQFPG